MPKGGPTMPGPILSDYFYGDGSEEFVFFKIPRQLITSPKYKHASTDAKLLYGMLLADVSPPWPAIPSSLPVSS